MSSSSINLYAKDYRVRFMLLREWEQKTDLFEADKKINQKFGNKIVSKRANYWYNNFNKGDKQIISESSSISVTSTQHGEPKNLLDSILLLTDEKCFNEKLLTKDGRFFILPYYDKVLGKFYIGIYDLFSGKKRMNPTSFGNINTQFKIVGDYLFALDDSEDTITRKLCIVQVNYDNLAIEKFNMMNFPPYYCGELYIDQLNEHRFAFFDGCRISIVQMNNEKDVLKRIRNTLGFGMLGGRLVGNKIQCFDFGVDAVKYLKFYEIDIEAKEMTKIDVLVKFGAVKNSNNFMLHFNYSFAYCWAANRFYGMFQRENYKYQLLSFDVETLKWSDVKIFNNQPTRFFVNENEVLTFCVKNVPGCSAVYRVALRKPDTLMNLARLSAVKEANIYGNEKYINIAKQIIV